MAMRLYFFVALVVFCGALAARPAAAGGETGSIAGVVFYDRNGDGIRDPGEPGMPLNRIRLEQDGIAVREVYTDGDGGYMLDQISAGEYTLNVETFRGFGACFIPWSFDPLGRCWRWTFVWRHTSPESVETTVTSGTTNNVDFGILPDDEFVVSGIALLEDNYAPEGTPIEARANGRECGRTAAGPRQGQFELHVLGAERRPGCPEAGDVVGFTVDGQEARETFVWPSFADLRGPSEYSGLALDLALVAMEEHAWYWFEVFGDELPAHGSVVEAVVDGAVCGHTTIDASREDIDVAGFSRLVVPSDAIQPGCGRLGAPVSFLVDGVESPTVLLWESGVQRIDLVIPSRPPADTPTPMPTAVTALPSGTAVPTPEPNMATGSPSAEAVGAGEAGTDGSGLAMPAAGAGTERAAQTGWPVPAAALALAGLLLAGGGLFLFRRT